MFYSEFISASRKHISWIQNKLYRAIKIKGHVTNDRKGTTIQLKYAKKESLRLLRQLYSDKTGLCLKRKKLKIDNALAIVGEHL
jgi:hypothetical protein